MDLSDISIIKLLPPNLARDNKVRMMCEAFDEELRRIIADIPGIAIIPNLVLKKIVDNLLLDLLAWQFHCDFYSPDLPIEKKQELILKSLDWHTRKGTPSVVEEIVSTVFSRAEVQEWFNYEGLPYRFRISTEEELPDGAARESLYRAIDSVKNKRSWLEKITTLIHFEDEFTVTDDLQMAVHHNGLEDNFKKRFKFNGAVKFDGVTLNNHIHVKSKVNGESKFDGHIDFSGTKKIDIPDCCRITPPFKFSSWIADTLSLSIGDMGFEDTQKARLRFDGSVRFSGEPKFDGISPYPVNDSFGSIQSEHTLIDNADAATETFDAAVLVDMEDDTKKVVKFDGKNKFNGATQFTDDYATRLDMDILEIPMSDDFELDDESFIGIRKHHFFNGEYQFDGSIKFDAMALIPVG